MSIGAAALKQAVERAKQINAVATSSKKRKQLVPLNNWVLIRKHLRESEISEGGIVTQKDEARSDVGTILAVSSSVRDCHGDALPVKVGDVVLYTHYSLTIEDVQEITDDPDVQTVRGEEIYFIVKELDEEIIPCT